MKEKFKLFYSTTREHITHGLEKAREHQIIQGFLQGVLIGAVIIGVGFLFIKALGYLYDWIYSFIDRHLVGVGVTAVGGCYLLSKHYERKDKRERLLAEEQRGWDEQKRLFNVGCYETIGGFLYANVCNIPNFTEMTALAPPAVPTDFGNSDTDAYPRNGQPHFRFAFPKSVPGTINVKHTASIMQSMIREQLRLKGLYPILNKTDCNKLVVEKVEDFGTVAYVSLVLDLDDTYLRQKAYDNAMTELLVKNQSYRKPGDNDYHG